MNNLLIFQLHKAGYVLTLFPYEIMNESYFPFVTIDNEKYKVPTLSELIEACGDKFYGLHKVVGGQWLAFIYDMDDCSQQLEVYAGTPEEAVARLWLALNKE